jgi:hypothetical protein
MAFCFKGQVVSDIDKGRRGSHGSCMLGVHMLGVEFLHFLCVIRVKVGDVGDAERELLGRARALVLELMH